MSSIARLTKQIRALPFADMMMLAEEIQAQLEARSQQKTDATLLAGVLSRLQEADIPPSEQTQEEDRVLQRIFKVKRTVSVSKHGTGWSIEIPTVPGSRVVGADLRELFPMMFDQIITLHVLMQK